MTLTGALCGRRVTMLWARHVGLFCMWDIVHLKLEIRQETVLLKLPLGAQSLLNRTSKGETRKVEGRQSWTSLWDLSGSKHIIRYSVFPICGALPGTVAVFCGLLCAAVARGCCIGSGSVLGGDFVKSFRVSLAKDHLADSE